MLPLFELGEILGASARICHLHTCTAYEEVFTRLFTLKVRWRGLGVQAPPAPEVGSAL